MILLLFCFFLSCVKVFLFSGNNPNVIFSFLFCNSAIIRCKRERFDVQKDTQHNEVNLWEGTQWLHLGSIYTLHHGTNWYFKVNPAIRNSFDRNECQPLKMMLKAEKLDRWKWKSDLEVYRFVFSCQTDRIRRRATLKWSWPLNGVNTRSNHSETLTHLYWNFSNSIARKKWITT